jgi:curved DNA-binding protein CbpA
MIDPFAVLGLPRRPWLNEDALKERFHRLAAEHHPDVHGGDETPFAEINAAHRTLRDTAMRLRCLLALEGFEMNGPAQIPDDLGRLFMDTGLARQKLETFLNKEESARSPIARAMLAPEKMMVMDAVETQIAALNEIRETLLEEIREIDRAWPRDAASGAQRLAAIAHSLAFVGKWLAQLREGYARLAL